VASFPPAGIGRIGTAAETVSTEVEPPLPGSGFRRPSASGHIALQCRPSVSPVWPFGWLLALARPGQANEVPLGAHESSNWARKESRRWESNPRPDDYKWPIPFRAEAHLVPGRVIFPA